MTTRAITETFLKKAATDAGFDIPPEENSPPGWWRCRSCRFDLSLWIRIAPHGADIAASAADVLEALRRECPGLPAGSADGLPPGAAGALAAPSADALFQLTARAAQLELSLPHRLADAFARETADMPQQTEAQRLATYRIGQDKLRQGLLEYWQGECAVTGLALPEVLRASHIKPWRECAGARERLDIHNALLLAPHLDALFDGGWITFADSGEIRFSALLKSAHREKLALTPAMKIRSVAPQHLPFLRHHQDRAFRNSAQPRRPAPAAAAPGA